MPAPSSTSWAEDAEEEAAGAAEITGAAEATEVADVTQLLESQYEVAVKLADMQGDPNSPLYSVRRFEDLGLCVSASIPPQRI